MAPRSRVSGSRTDSFTILPPFWRTGWFLAVSLASTIAVFIGLETVGVRRLEKQRRRLEERIAQSTAGLCVEKEKVEQVNDELEERVSERTRELVRANDSLRHQVALAKKLDDESVQRAAKKILSRFGYDVTLAEDFCDVLAKPFDAGALGALVERVLQ